MSSKLIKALVAGGALAVAASSAGAADTYVVDPIHSEAAFQVRHLVSKVRGRFGDFKGVILADAQRPEASRVEFTIRAASIDTANADRDRHLQSPDFFDVEKYPEISFKSRTVAARGQGRYDVSGTLSMHGVSKEVTLPVAFLGAGKDPWGNERAGFETSLTLDRKDYGIVWNKALDAGGYLLGDDVLVTINLEAIKKADAAASN